MVGGRVTRDCRACGLESARSIARSPSPHASTHRCVRRPAGCRRAWRAGDLNLPLDALLSSTALTLRASACCIQLEGDPGCCPVQAGRSPAFFCANGLKLQLVFPVQSVAPQPRGAVPLVMGVSREPQRCCWFFQLSWPAPECAIHAFIPIVAPIYWLNGVLRASYSAGAPHVRRSTFRKTEVRAASQVRTARYARRPSCGDLNLFGDATEPLADRGSIALRSRRE